MNKTGRPRIHESDQGGVRMAARRARVKAAGGRQLTILLDPGEVAALAALRAREGLPSDAATLAFALRRAAGGEGWG